jgi:hypothetical protein
MPDTKDQTAEDRKVMVGGPDVPENPPDQPQTPPRHRVKIAGRDFEIDPDLAAALEEREREFQRKLSEQGAELGALRRLAQRAPAPPQAPAEEPLSTMIFTDPDRAIQRLRQDIMQELENRYRQDQAWREFWTEFDRAHPALAGERALVQAVLQEHFTEVADLPVRQAIARIGELTTQKLVGLAARARGNPERTLVEGGGTGPAAKPPKPEEPEPKSLSQLLRERRAVRYKTSQ